MTTTNVHTVRARQSLMMLAQRLNTMKQLPSNGFIAKPETEQQKHPVRKQRDIDENYSIFVYSIPFVLSVVCYSNTLNGDFVHDDVFAIVQNRDVTGDGQLSDVWFNDFWGRPMVSYTSHKSYRPLTILMFRLDYILGYGDPTWFHIVNTILHACVTCCVAHVCINVLHTSLLCAVLTSSLFAVHPIHTEAVSSIVGRADVLAGLLFLLSLMAYARCVDLQGSSTEDIPATVNTSCSSQLPTSSHSWFWLSSSIVLSVASSLCKETGFTVFGVCFLYDVIHHSETIITLRHERRESKEGSPPCLRSLRTRLFALIMTAILFMFFRLHIMNYEPPTFKPEDNLASFSDSFLTRVMTFNYLLPFNLWLLLCPNVLCYDWQVGSIPLVESVKDNRNVITIVFYVTAVCLLWKCWQCINFHSKTGSQTADVDRSDSGIIPMAVVLMCVPFLPASNMFFRIGFVVAERILYIPSIGFCILVSQGIVQLCNAHSRFKGHVLAFAVVLLMTLAGKTWQRNPVWASRKGLFWSGVETLPNNAKAHFNMANYYRDTGANQNAIEHYKRAIELYPQHPSYHNNLGTILTNQSEAEYHFRQALSLYPKHKGALVNLGNLMVVRGDKIGLNMIRRALMIDPVFVDALLSMGKGLISYNQYREAEGYIKEAIRLQPDLPDAYSYYGFLFHQTGRLEHAITAYQTAFTLNSRNTVAMTNAAISLRVLRRYSEAEVLLKRALSLQGGSDIYSQLGILYAEMGQKLEALFAYKEALTISPNSTTVNLRYIQALIESNQHHEAKQSLSNLLSKTGNDLEVLDFAYTYQQKLGQLHEALRYLNEAIIQANRLGHASLGKLYQDKANVYLEWNDLGTSLKYFKKSIHEDPTLVDSFINTGTIYYMQHNYRGAEEFYRKALTLNPVNELARSNLDKLKAVWKSSIRDKR